MHPADRIAVWIVAACICLYVGTIAMLVVYSVIPIAEVAVLIGVSTGYLLFRTIWNRFVPKSET